MQFCLVLRAHTGCEKQTRAETFKRRHVVQLLLYCSLKHWYEKFPEPKSNPDSRLCSVRSQHWLFVLDTRVKCGEKTSHNWKPSLKTEVSVVTIWTLEGCASSAKTVDPQFHFKGMEVWKQSHETNTSNTQGKLELGVNSGTNLRLENFLFSQRLKPSY